MRPAVVFHRDRFVALESAGAGAIGVDDPGYLLGDGVFATLRARRGVPFLLGEHLARIARGAELFGFALPLSLDRIGDVAREAAARTEERDAYVRITLTRAGTLPPDDTRANLVVIARALDVPSEAERMRGVDSGIVTLRRPPASCGDPFVKTTSYAGAVLARREARARGWSEGIQLAVDGTVASGAMSNLFLVRGRRLVTPSLASGCRAGVTRALVLDLARREGLVVEEADVPLAALDDADEIFFTSTRVSCLPVRTIGERSHTRERFPVTRALDDAIERALEASP